jgi:uncharacterized coiled-coil DUF342 family protein
MRDGGKAGKSTAGAATRSSLHDRVDELEGKHDAYSARVAYVEGQVQEHRGIIFDTSALTKEMKAAYEGVHQKVTEIDLRQNETETKVGHAMAWIDSAGVWHRGAGPI